MISSFKKLLNEITQKELIQKVKELEEDLGMEDLSEKEKSDIKQLIDKINQILDFEKAT